MKNDELKLSGTKVPIKFNYVNDDNEEDSFTIEIDSHIFLILSQEALNKGVKVEDIIIDTLLESLD